MSNCELKRLNWNNVFRRSFCVDYRDNRITRKDKSEYKSKHKN